MDADPTSALTFSEISDLNKRKLDIKANNTEYLSSHPEVRSMLNDFMSSCLLEKPDDVYGFAKEFFAEMRPEHSLAAGVGGWQPVVICGPSGGERECKGCLISITNISNSSISR